jgi:hypothetical protein
MPIKEWCLTPGTPISLQWEYLPFEKVLVPKHPSCRITPPKYVHTNVEYFVEIMHIDFRIKNTTWKMTSHECENHFQNRYSGEIIYNLDFGTY